MLVKNSSHTGSACSAWLPRMPTYSSRPSMYCSAMRRRADAFVDERDALLQLLVAVDDRRLRDADRGFLRQRLHDQRELRAASGGGSAGRCGTPRTRAPECGDRRAASSRATCRGRAAGRADCSRCTTASAARDSETTFWSKIVTSSNAFEQVEGDVRLPLGRRGGGSRRGRRGRRAAAPRGPAPRSVEMTSYSVRHGSDVMSVPSSTVSGGIRCRWTSARTRSLLTVTAPPDAVRCADSSSSAP